MDSSSSLRQLSALPPQHAKRIPSIRLNIRLAKRSLDVVSPSLGFMLTQICVLDLCLVCLKPAMEPKKPKKCLRGHIMDQSGSSAL